MTQWIEDWFGSEYYSILYKHRSCDEAALFLDHLTAFLKAAPGSRILDCGCGKGRHSIHLSSKGFEVTGIDISNKNISETKKHESKSLEFFTHDMRNLFRINYYDVVLNLFTSFGYFESDSENDKMIRATTAALKKGGWFVLDFMNVEREIRKLAPEEKTKIHDIDFTISRSTKKNCIIKVINVCDKGKDYAFRENVKAYKRTDLENFFTRNGLEVLHLFGNYELQPFDESRSERLILIGKKK